MSSPDPPEVSSVQELYSPLPFILEEESYRDAQAVEAVLLTFNMDYGFFERTILGPLQATGARITTVADAGVNAPDVRAARRAGVSYVPGLAAVPGAFHPKVVVVGGLSRAMVAIGSGNVSIGGWQYNAETWVVGRADETGYPDWLADLALWLHDLPAHVAIAPRAAHGCQRASRVLDHVIGSATAQSTGQRLVHNLETSILDQLPQGPVDELVLYAPFHDPRGSAIEKLIDRFDPTHVTLTIQPGLTMTDPARLQELTARHPLVVLADDDGDRYRHGKLVEWRIGEQRWALTGSANLSVSAFCRTVMDANCEIGIVTDLGTRSLAPPASAAVDLDRLSAPDSWALGRERMIAAPILLSATIEEAGLYLTLARAFANELVVQVSPYSEDPDVWLSQGSVPSGTSSVDLPIETVGGSRVRLLGRAADGAPLVSNVVFVIDPGAVIRRAAAPSSTRRHRPELGQLFEDFGAATGFLQELENLAAGVAATTLPRAAASGEADAAERHGSHRLDSDEDGWLSYLEGTASRLGEDLLSFALPLPDLPALGPGVLDRTVDWDDLLADDDVAGLSDDTAEEVDAETSDSNEAASGQAVEEPQPPDLRGLSEEGKRRYRRWVGKLSELVDRLPAPERLAAVRLLLWTTRSGIWPRDADEWYFALASATRALVRHEPPERLRGATASLAAVAITVLYEHTPFSVTTDRTREYERVSQELTEMLLFADEQLIAKYALHLHNRYEGELTPELVSEVVEHICDEDPFTNVMDRVRDQGWDIERPGQRLLIVRGDFGNPVLRAHRVLALAESLGPVGVWAVNDRGDWSFAAWSKPELIRIDHIKGSSLWRHYRLERLVGPASLAQQMRFNPGAARDYEIDHIPRSRPFEEALVLMSALGVSDPQPPNH